MSDNTGDPARTDGRMPALEAMMTAAQERYRSSFTIAVLLTVAGPAPSVAQLRRRVVRCWGGQDRLRLRPVTDPAGRPRRPYRWTAGRAWDPAAHVRVTGPAPGQDLRGLAAGLVGPCLPERPGGPLWQLHLVPALPGAPDGHALLLRAHHALLDMASLGRLARLLCHEGGAAGASGSARGTPTGTAEDARTALPVLHALHGVARRAGRRTGARAVPAAGGPGPRVSWADLPYAVMETARGALPDARVTVNDVVLAALTAALRATPPALDGYARLDRVYGGVPVDLRGPADAERLGNLLSAVRLRLPVWSDDPVTRLRAVHRAMRRNKDRRRALGGARVTDAAGGLGPWGVHAMSRFMYADPGTITLSCSNARLCDRPLTMDGAPVESLTGVSFVVPHARFQFLLTTYHRTHTFGVTGDHTCGPWLDDLTAAFATEVRRLADLA